MRTSRTFRPAVDGLETRKLLSGTVAPAGENASLGYISGTLRGNWTATSPLSPTTHQNQTLHGGDTATFKNNTPNGFKLDPLGVTLNSSSLSISALTVVQLPGHQVETRIAKGSLKLTITQDVYGFGIVYTNQVTLPVAGINVKVEGAKDSYEEITGTLQFPNTNRGGAETILSGAINFKEVVNPNKSSGSFELTFRKP
jgi:hypothetical protein